LHGSLGQWEQAQADFLEIVRQRPTDFFARFFPMLLAAQTGDRERYQQHRREALQRLAKAKSYAHVYELMSRAALLLPAEGDELKVASQSADLAVKGDQNPMRLRWSRLAKGLAEYRGGAFRSAIDWLEKSRQLLPESPVPHLEAQALCLQAMAHERLGEKDKARELLAQASKVINEQLPKDDSGALGEGWPDWIIAHVLRREAEVLIVGEIKSEQEALAELAKAVERTPTPQIGVGERGELSSSLQNAAFF
jgi:tetratricopeptide (TPR) repeat protein